MRFNAIFAASAIALAASPAVAATPTGVRVEALVGVDDAHLDSFGIQDDPSESGLLYGVGVGYDFALGRSLSLGVDLEATDSNTEFRFVSGPDNNHFNLGRDLYAGVRVTAAVSDAVNLYAKAGYTNLSIRRDLINPTFPEVIESNEGGLRGGAGVQFGLGGGAYVGAEYRFSTYDELDRHQGVAALGYRF